MTYKRHSYLVANGDRNDEQGLQSFYPNPRNHTGKVKMQVQSYGIKENITMCAPEDPNSDFI